ncbi:hypothetical protein DITRI_Ditri18aG0035700 [Diplodiscus trichospermus]
MQEKFVRLEAELEEINEEQKDIREIESECEELNGETGIIIQQTERTQIKLALMFRIFKASQQFDLATIANLTRFGTFSFV